MSSSTFSVDISLHEIPDDQYEYVLERLEDALQAIRNEVPFDYQIGIMNWLIKGE